jgi:hypothetical protein
MISAWQPESFTTAQRFHAYLNEARSCEGRGDGGFMAAHPGLFDCFGKV